MRSEWTHLTVVVARGKLMLNLIHVCPFMFPPKPGQNGLNNQAIYHRHIPHSVHVLFMMFCYRPTKFVIDIAVLKY